MPVIIDFIKTEVLRQKEIADTLADDHNKNWEALNRVFSEVLCG